MSQPRKLNGGLQFSLPYPPTINHYYIHSSKRNVIGKKGVAYRNDVYYAVRGKKPAEALTTRLSLTITAIMPDKRKRDLDNIQKAVLDSLQNAGVYVDDSQIDDLRVIRGPIQSPGRLKIEIREFA